MKNKLPYFFILLTTLLTSCNNSNTSSFSSFLDSESQQESSSAKSNTYKNSLTSFSCADPAVFKDPISGKYYCYSTTATADFGGNIGYQYLGVPILESDDMVNWECVGSVFNRTTMPNWGTTSSPSVWAPDIQYIQNQYVLYYSLSKWDDPNPGIGIATSDNPIGPWIDRGKLLISNEIGVKNSIDPCCFIDDDGSVYLIWGSFCGTYGIELSSDGLSIKPGCEKVLIAGYAARNWDGALYEGAYLRKYNDLYYLFLSTGTCCEGYDSTYKVVCGISEEPLGDYIDQDDTYLVPNETRNAGTLVIDGDGERFYGTGHISIVVDDNEDWWMYYHGYDSHVGNSSRVLMLDKLIMNEGYPHVANYKTSKESTCPFVNIN